MPSENIYKILLKPSKNVIKNDDCIQNDGSDSPLKQFFQNPRS